MNAYLALALAVAYGLFASFQWWTAAPKCDNTALTDRIAELEASAGATRQAVTEAAVAQQEVVDSGDEAVREIAETFAPLKEKVREIHVDSCAGAFDVGVRQAVNDAADATNQAYRELPAASDTARAATTHAELQGMDRGRPSLGRGSPGASAPGKVIPETGTNLL